jgi:membrane-bound lytic murein transglycosylase D
MFRVRMFLAWLMAACVVQAAPPRVPATMDFCGIKLNFTPAARARLQQEVDKLTANATYHQKLAERAALYMPFVRDAFAHIGVPADLTIICVQESGLRGDAVSPSKAVGFWQLKDYTAEETGILVNAQIDERKHISRASVAAARYLFKKNLQFNNWVYAVIAYYEGGTGALPYVDADNFGSNNMTVDDNLHWYALRVIAHKIAFADVLEDQKPGLYLQARSTGGETNLGRVIEKSKLNRADFLQYNLWATGTTLPKGRPMTYFVPATGKHARHEPDPHLDFFEKPGPPQYAYAKPAPLKGKPDARPAQLLLPKQPGTLATSPKLADVTGEAWYNHQFTFATGNEDLAVVAQRTGLSVKKVRKYNPALPNGLLPAGTRVLLMPPGRVEVHIARMGETIESIAIAYDHYSHKLAKLNGLQYNSPVEPGRKIYLRHPKPPSEGIKRYAIPGLKFNTVPTTNEQVINQPTPNTPVTDAKPTALSTNAVERPNTSPVNAAVSTSNPQQGGDKLANAQPANTIPTTGDPSAAIPTGSAPNTNNTSGNTAKLTTSPQPYTQMGATPAGNQQPVKTLPTGLGTAAVGKPNQVGLNNTGGVKPVDSIRKPAPVGPPRYVSYTVAKGESLFAIAKKFGMTVDELRAVNKLPGYSINLGATLRVRAQ